MATLLMSQFCRKFRKCNNVSVQSAIMRGSRVSNEYRGAFEVTINVRFDTIDSKRSVFEYHSDSANPEQDLVWFGCDGTLLKYRACLSSTCQEISVDNQIDPVNVAVKGMVSGILVGTTAEYKFGTDATGRMYITKNGSEIASQTGGIVPENKARANKLLGQTQLSSSGYSGFDGAVLGLSLVNAADPADPIQADK